MENTQKRWVEVMRNSMSNEVKNFSEIRSEISILDQSLKSDLEMVSNNLTIK